ncbi:exopolysaccharide biosynthesis protein [Roseovarius sp. SCSIO 43702]|uniref:exopolysaccharide biosynthesis protein n=1 Tax=Roseovarius sp. SCSIO 43702 TaxID=2823043 RepID=UPI002175ED55|nr:exopolysaccharide biosynthesis protein [Roseovarius sp. SCSIO 43702]
MSAGATKKQGQHAADDGPLLEIMDELESLTSQDEVSFGDVLDRLGDHGLLPLVLIPALICATPLSGIPGVSMICGVMIAILSFELLFRFRRAWLPGFVTRRSIKGRKLRDGLETAEPYVRWIERRTKDRMTFLFHRPMIWVPQGLCVVTGAAMPFLEFIPFSSSLCAIAVCFLVMAMLTEDGVFFLIALLPYGAVFYLIYRVVT